MNDTRESSLLQYNLVMYDARVIVFSGGADLRIGRQTDRQIGRHCGGGD